MATSVDIAGLFPLNGPLPVSREAPPCRGDRPGNRTATPLVNREPLSGLAVMTPSLSQCARRNGENCGKSSATQVRRRLSDGSTAVFCLVAIPMPPVGHPSKAKSPAERRRGFPMVPTSGT